MPAPGTTRCCSTGPLLLCHFRHLQIGREYLTPIKKAQVTILLTDIVDCPSPGSSGEEGDWMTTFRNHHQAGESALGKADGQAVEVKILQS